MPTRARIGVSTYGRCALLAWIDLDYAPHTTIPSPWLRVEQGL